MAVKKKRGHSKAPNEKQESAKEELQSLNEELSTANNQLRDTVRYLETANNDLVNLLNCTDIAIVWLDTGLRIKRFTPATTRLFNLIATDIGRPIGDIVKRFKDDDLLVDAQQLLRDLTPVEKEVPTEDNRWYARRITPHRKRDNRIDGIVITLVEITKRKWAADAIAQRLAAVVESSADAIFSKDLDGTVRSWNQGAERLYGYAAEEIVGQSIRVTVPGDRAEEWRHAMARLARGEHVEQLETERVHKDGRRISVMVTYSPIQDSVGKVVGVSAIARDVSERKRAEATLRDREERLQAILHTAMDAIITIDYRGIIQSVNDAAERMFGYTAVEMIGQSVNMLIPTPYRKAHDGYLARYLQTGEKHIIDAIRETEAQRKDGTVFPVDLAVNEIKHLKLFTGIHHDLTKRKQLERDVVEIASQEQRRIGQDLHDSVAQELTALSLLAGDLTESLQNDPNHALNLVERIVQGLQRSQNELRSVLRGLLPVSVDGRGLMSALDDLATRVNKETSVMCTFDCPKPVAVADNVTATHLFLIAQEAVHNAVTHGQPRNVRIALLSNDRMVLTVRCDGVGMATMPPQNQGMGLRIMHNRAAIIGATLTIERAQPTGTLVTCALARKMR